MKKGDIVRVIAFASGDEETSLQIGHTGVIVRKYEYATQTPVYAVRFGANRIPADALNREEDGTYQMFEEQLELIRQE